MAYAEIENASLNLTAYRTRLSDLSWCSDPFLRPICMSVGPHRSVRLHLAFRGVRRFSLTAQLLNAGANCREMISRARLGLWVTAIPAV
jgi:hypothetical protein